MAGVVAGVDARPAARESLVVTDEMLDAMVEYMARPSPTPGSNVTVGGRPGTVVEYLPGEMPGNPGLVTCTTTYVVDHDGELVTYVVNDWAQSAPKVEFVA